MVAVLKTNWTELKQEELLKLRICDLGLKWEQSELAPIVEELYREIEAKNLKHFKPKIYLGDEWFSPDGVPAIAIPFYLAHPRLRELEEEMMFEVEGGSKQECLQLLRHETGHCFDHAYRFSKRKRWKKIFGSPNEDYDPDHYLPRPYSRNYVHHLENWYAQAHPEEDFAETFAVWLDPYSNWKNTYGKWKKAFEKLSLIDELAQEVSNQEPLFTRGPLYCSASRLTTTLENYYKKRKREYQHDLPDSFDADLKRLFSAGQERTKKEAAAQKFLKARQIVITDSVARWTGAKKYTVHVIYKKLKARCQELDLRVGEDAQRIELELSAYLATLVTNYLFTGKFKRTV